MHLSARNIVYYLSGPGRGPGPGPPVLIKLLIIVLAFIIRLSDADKSQFHHIQSLCKNRFLQQVYRKIDGSVLFSQNERNLDCVITFQTHSILQRFMLRYDYLHLDCNDHLYIYDGAHAVGTYKSDITCRDTKQSIGAIFTRTNFVTLRYVTDEWGTSDNGFKLVITAFKDSKHTCKDFRCNSREFCISKDLTCDGIKHCFDESDEAGEICPDNESMIAIYGIDVKLFAVILTSISLVLTVVIIFTITCVCKRSPKSANVDQDGQNHQQPPNTYSLQQMYGSNGTLKSQHTTLLSKKTPTTPIQGNYYRPAGHCEYPTQTNSHLYPICIVQIWRICRQAI